MAQADFDFANIGSSGHVGGAQGSALLHASLGSPLAGEGDYGREYFRVSGQTNSLATLKTSVSGGIFYEIDETKAISLRAWIRITDVDDSSDSIGLVARADPTDLTLDDRPAKGYHVFVGDHTVGGATTTLRLFMRGDGGGQVVVNTGYTVANNTWYKVRMDVIPVSTSNDIIKIYTGTGATGSETWTLRHTEYVSKTQTHFVAAGATGAGKVGYWAMGGTERAYIDRFQVFLEDV